MCLYMPYMVYYQCHVGLHCGAYYSNCAVIGHFTCQTATSLGQAGCRIVTGPFFSQGGWGLGLRLRCRWNYHIELCSFLLFTTAAIRGAFSAHLLRILSQSAYLTTLFTFAASTYLTIWMRQQQVLHNQRYDMEAKASNVAYAPINGMPHLAYIPGADVGERRGIWHWNLPRGFGT